MIQEDCFGADDCFVQIVPTEAEPVGFRYTVRATIRDGKELVLYEGNDIDLSCEVFSANHGKYRTLCWSIDHSVEVRNRKKGLLKRLMGLLALN